MVAHRLLVPPKQTAMKTQEINPNFDQNWAWPKKTWFRERLNALRARDEEEHRRLRGTRKDPGMIEVQAAADREGKKD